MNTLVRPNQCSQCNGKARYTCPRCTVRTCSLACVQAHKDLTSCSGVRDKTVYVSIKEYTNFNLLSDYRLLEEATRVTSNANRNKNIKRIHLMNKKGPLPSWLHRLRVEAKIRGTTLKIMPHIFTRRKKNTTCFIAKLRKIMWHIEWQFPHVGLSFSDKKVDEDNTCGSVLRRYLDDPNQQYERLAIYRACGLLGIKVLLKAEDRPSTDNKYYEIDPESSLKNILKKKTITEFPTFLVILKEHASSYDILKEISEPETSDEAKGALEMNKISKPETSGESKGVLEINKISEPETSETKGVLEINTISEPETSGQSKDALEMNSKTEDPEVSPRNSTLESHHEMEDPTSIEIKVATVDS